MITVASENRPRRPIKPSEKATMDKLGLPIITGTGDNRSKSIDVNFRCQDTVVIDTSNDA